MENEFDPNREPSYVPIYVEKLRKINREDLADLYQYAWARLRDLTDQQQEQLFKALRADDRLIIAIIRSAQQWELTQSKDRFTADDAKLVAIDKLSDIKKELGRVTGSVDLDKPDPYLYDEDKPD